MNLVRAGTPQKGGMKPVPGGGFCDIAPQLLLGIAKQERPLLTLRQKDRGERIGRDTGAHLASFPPVAAVKTAVGRRKI